MNLQCLPSFLVSFSILNHEGYQKNHIAQEVRWSSYSFFEIFTKHRSRLGGPPINHLLKHAVEAYIFARRNRQERVQVLTRQHIKLDSCSLKTLSQWVLDQLRYIKCSTPYQFSYVVFYLDNLHVHIENSCCNFPKGKPPREN